MSDNTTPKGEFQKRIKRTRFTPDGTDYFKSLRAQCGGGNIFANSLKMNQMNQVKPIDIPKALARLKELHQKTLQSLEALGKGIAYLEANLPATPAQALIDDPYAVPYMANPIVGGTSILPHFEKVEEHPPIPEEHKPVKNLGTNKGDYWTLNEQELQQLFQEKRVKKTKSGKIFYGNSIFVKNVEPKGKDLKYSVKNVLSFARTLAANY